MVTPNDAAVTELKKDVDSKHLDKFIADYQKDLKNITDVNQQKALTAEAQKILVAAKLIPNVDILDGTSNGHLDLKDASQQHLAMDSSGVVRDDKNRVVQTGGTEPNTYGYDAQSGELNKVTWNDGTNNHTLQKQADGWHDEKGQKFDAGKEPKIDPATGDLTYTRPGDTTQSTVKADGTLVNKAADGSVVTYNPDGAVNSVVDKNHNSRTVQTRDADGNPTSIEYKEPGGFTDHWDKKADGTWQNRENPSRKLKDLGFDDNGTYHETAADGSKDTFPPNGTHTHQTAWQAQREDYRGKLPDAMKDKDTVKIDHGATLWDIAKENLKKHSSDHHDPSNTEIANETNRLIKKYNDDPAHKNKINPDGKNVPIGTEINTAIDSKTGDDHQTITYDGKGNKPENVNDVKYPNGNTTHVEHNADGTVKTMHIKDGDKTYDVTNTNGKYTVKDDKGVTTAIDAPTIDANTGDVTLKRSDGKGSIEINSDGTDTITGADGQAIDYDGKGHADKNITDITYANHESVHFDRAADGTVTKGTITGPDGKVKYQLTPEANGKYKLSDGTGKDLNTDISTIKTDPVTGALELDGTTGKDSKPYKLNIDTKGAETTSNTPAEAPPPPQPKQPHTDQIANGPAVTYDAASTDPNHLTDLKYGDKAKAHFDRNQDGSIKDGTLSFGGKDFKMVPEGDHLALHLVGPNGQEVDTKFTFKSTDVKVDPKTGQLYIDGMQNGQATHIIVNPDGTPGK